MKMIGTYNGIKCYSCSMIEYENTLKSGCDDGSSIFIIDGDMVCKNVVIGYYDGHKVRDDYSGKKYREIEKPVVKVAVSADDKEIDLAALVSDFDYSKYSQEVDNFFATVGR